MTPTFTYRPDPDHDAMDVDLDECTIVIEPGECHDGQTGHHVALYPAFVLRAALDELPPPLWEAVLPAPSGAFRHDTFPFLSVPLPRIHNRRK